MLKLSQALLAQMAQRMRGFIRENPDTPLFEEYPNPAKEFDVHIVGNTIAITHPSIETVFLTSTD